MNDENRIEGRNPVIPSSPSKMTANGTILSPTRSVFGDDKGQALTGKQEHCNVSGRSAIPLREHGN